MTITVQRETLYSEQLSVVGVADGISFKIVWCWRKHARSQDWYLEKTVVKADGEITMELSETEASKMPFVDGYVSIYKIDASTSKKTLYATYDVRVSEGTAGSDYTATSGLSVAVPALFDLEGGAVVGRLAGRFYCSSDGYITRLTCGAQEAPTGDSIIFAIYKNGSATGDTITLASGDLTNTATSSIAVAQNDYIDVYLTQVGDLGTGTHPFIMLDVQYS